MSRGIVWMSVAVAFVVVFVARPVAAQAPTGTILGVVKDAQGAVIPGATVTATNLGTTYSRDAVTGVDGEYSLRLLPIGNYKVVVTLAGFKSFSQTGIALEVGPVSYTHLTLPTNREV